jgi:hypothetical protein
MDQANITRKQIEGMDSESKLTKALAAGAVLMFRPNVMNLPESQKRIEKAFLELKEMLQERYESVDENLLDLGPGSAERQQAIAEQLRDSGATQDEGILRQAEQLLEIIAEEDPSALWASQVDESNPI